MSKGATSKRTRKIKEYKQEYNNKRSQVENIRKLLKKNNTIMAKKCIDNYLNEYGKDGYILHELGKYYLALNELEESISCYEQVIYNNYENKYYSMYELAKIEKYNGNFDKALELLDNIINSKHKETCHAKLEKAKILYILNRYDEFLDIITSLIITNQENKVYAFDALMDYVIDFYDVKLAKKIYNIIKKDLNEDEDLFYSAIIDKVEDRIPLSREKLERLTHCNSEFKYRSKYQLAVLDYEAENYLEAIENAEIVSNNYPGLATVSYRLLANIYMFLKEFDKSEYYIEKLKEYGSSQEQIVNELYGNLYFNQQKYDESLEYFLKVEEGNKAVYYEALEKIGFILIKEKKYEQALDHFNKISENDCTDRFKLDGLFSKVFLKKQLNREITEEADFYSIKQILNYDKDKAIEHIKEHKEEKNNKIIHSVFYPEIDIEELYEYAVNNINEENFNYNNFMDLYTLEYPNVGTINGKNVNHVTVVTIPNSKEIITMYPFNKIDLNTNNKTSKVKKMSRIDKFKQKYGM